MRRVAIILHKDDTVAPVDDNGRHYEAVKVFDVNGQVETADLVIDPKSDDFALSVGLVTAKVTDVIGQHFEDVCFEELSRLNIHMWLEGPDIDAGTALQAWRDGLLPEAKVGAHAVHGPEGKRVRHSSPRQRHGIHEPPGGGRSVGTPGVGRLPF